MAPESSHDGTVPSSKETQNRLEWWIDIKEEQELLKEPLIETKGRQQQQTRPETVIEKVDNELRKSHKPHFDPSRVSFGPYHHKKKGTESMETYKSVAARWFVSLEADKPGERITKDDAMETYKKFLKKVETLSPKDCYPGRTRRNYKDADLMTMMFLDGCFVLNFIHLVADKSDASCGLQKCRSRLNQPDIISDMFLLENQIPYTVLNALMILTRKESFHRKLIIQFIYMVFLPAYEVHTSQIGCIRGLYSNLKGIFFSRTQKDDEDTECHHLLDLLRAKLIGHGARPSSPQGAQSGASPASSSSPGSGYRYFYLPPISELKAAGIQVRRSKSWFLKDVKFNKGHFTSHLEIPPIMIDYSTKTRLLNFVTYEMCSDCPKDRTVTSYVCFLSSLISNVDDVKDLQSKNILLNRLSSNQEVLNLFTLANKLSPDYKAYGDVIEGIDNHFKRHFNRERVRIGEWIGQFIRTYFTSPWTLISLIAAVLVVGLTLLQTIYSIWAFYKTY